MTTTQNRGYIDIAKSQEWETPTDLFNILNSIFHFQTDLACTSRNKRCKNGIYPEEDALSKNWGDKGNCWLNPPYGRDLQKWVEACYRHIHKHHNNNLVVMLIPSSTETKFWQNRIFTSANDVLFLNGRLKFEIDGQSLGSSPKGSALVFWGMMADRQRFQLINAKLGKLIHLNGDFIEQYIAYQEALAAISKEL